MAKSITKTDGKTTAGVVSKYGPDYKGNVKKKSVTGPTAPAMKKGGIVKSKKK
jgi:hypothetical protein